MTDVTTTHRIEAPREELALLVHKNANEIIPLRGRTITIGREQTNDVVLKDRTVSSRHCQVADEAGAYRVKDLGSRNGTILNGVSVSEGLLRSGARLEVGRETLLCVRRPTSMTMGAGPDRLVGKSGAMRALKADLIRFAPRDAPVLLLGESGTGKELAARYLHRFSPRSQGPFVSVNCGALPSELAMSELFGHERGAFTGASVLHRGAFEQAHTGTLFLDEIGELDSRLQAALLRVLETGELRRLGAEQDNPLRVRIIAATNRDLLAAMRTRDFRRDLYHRLAVLVVHVPPLRHRVSDIPLIVQALLERAGARHSFSEEAMDKLKRHLWPGNVRELRNVLERACALCAEPLVSVDELRFDTFRGRQVGEEEAGLLDLLDQHDGNVTSLSRSLGLSRTTVRDRINRLRRRPYDL